MSLLNQVLRDLDARDDDEVKQRLHLAPEPAPRPVPEPRPIDWLRLVVWSFTGGAIILWLASGLLLKTPDDRHQVMQKRVVQLPLPAKPASSAPVTIPPAAKNEPVETTATEPAKIAFQKTEPVPILSDGQQEVEVAVPLTPPAVEPKPAIAEQSPPVTSEESKRAATPAEPVLEKTEKQLPLTARAKQLISEGELGRAEQMLRDHLLNHPRLSAAHELLVGVMLRGGRNEEALAQIEVAQRESGYNSNLELIAARLLMDQGQAKPAEERLARLLEQAPGNLAAKRLLAAKWYADGRQDEAGALYLELVAHAEANARDWLGLAVSVDGKDQQLALRAYRQASQGPGLDRNTQSYIQQRIRVLGESSS